ncbi:MAG: hypothetical protein ITG04_10905 [Proteiniphilum sp.]|jgi:hypothetical protein|nr:hypothetical protein [Proteiniphilum sp.]MDD4632343.1 hypothetical protein [Proteiniphilum sp.]
MRTFKPNLRKMATIVACLAATTSFASCDKTNGVEDDYNKETQINSPIVSHYWEYWLYSDVSGIYYYFDYVFKPDGTFFYVIRSSLDCFATVHKGDYRVQNNTISIKNRKKSPQFNYDEKGYFKPPWTRYEEIAAIIEASKTVTFTNATDLSDINELTFSLSTSTQELTEYETQLLHITDAKGDERTFRKVKKI